MVFRVSPFKTDQRENCERELAPHTPSLKEGRKEKMGHKRLPKKKERPLPNFLTNRLSQVIT